MRPGIGNNSKIEDGIRQCESELDIVITKFTIIGNIDMHQAQSRLLQIVQSHQDEWRSSVLQQGQEFRTLVLETLQNQQDLLYAAELHRAGQPTAERLMEEGQRFLAEQSAHDTPTAEGEREQFRRGLAELQRLTGIPPTIKRLDGEVVRLGDMPVERGGHSALWQGLWLGRNKVHFLCNRT